MQSPARPDEETGRLDALHSYQVLDTAPDPALDELTALAARICGAPIGRVALLDSDRHWFKARFGSPLAELARDPSVRERALFQRDLFMVDDAVDDSLAGGNPFITGEPGIRFYAGAPLVTPAGAVIGALCVLDYVPRTLTESQQDALRVLSGQVMVQLELRRQAREMAARERLLQAVFDSEPECVKVLSRDGSLLMMNRAGLRMIEADSFSEVAGDCVYPLVVPADRAKFQGLTEQVFGGCPGVVEVQVVGLKGAELWMESNATPLRDEAGKVTALLAITRDITTRKHAEAELLRSREWLDSLVHSVDGIVWESDAETFQFTFVSQRAERLLGYPVERWLSEPTFWRDHLHPDDRDRAVALCTEAAADARDHELEYRMIAADGGVFWLRDIVTVVVEDGRPAKLRGLMVDITRQVQLEEQLRQSQKLDAIGQLAGGVAHDFNNILMAITMQAEMAGMAPGLSPETQQYLDDIRAQAHRAASLTRQLLTFSRRQVMQSGPLDVNEAVTNLSKMLRRILGADVKLTLALHPAALMVRADPGMLDQVLMNLVVNARDAMPTGGLLTIATATILIREGDPRATAGVAAGPFVVLRVIDTGSGISAEHLRHVFEPFFTTKETGKGTGLGLATVFGIVKQHGGMIRVISEVGRGTTFEILLPADGALATTDATLRSLAPARGGTETILVVEDEPSVRALNRAVLARNGYTVLEAAHGVDALRIWDEHHGEIDLLLTDLVMPGGIGGRELALRLRERKPGLKVIFTSGYSAENAGAGFNLQVGQNFLQKPSTLRQLLDTVRRCLDSVDEGTPTHAAAPLPAGVPSA